MSKALILIDIQNFYFGEDGLENNIGASLKAKELLELCRRNNIPVFHVKHLLKRNASQENYDRLISIHENVKPIKGEIIIEKRYPSSFRETELLSNLRDNGINELIICGMMSHMCIDTTTRQASNLGFSCIVVHDACATRALTFKDVIVPAEFVHATSMAALQANFAKVISTEDCIKVLSE